MVFSIVCMCVCVQHSKEALWWRNSRLHSTTLVLYNSKLTFSIQHSKPRDYPDWNTGDGLQFQHWFLWGRAVLWGEKNVLSLLKREREHKQNILPDFNINKGEKSIRESQREEFSFKIQRVHLRKVQNTQKIN